MEVAEGGQWGHVTVGELLEALREVRPPASALSAPLAGPRPPRRCPPRRSVRAAREKPRGLTG